MKIGDEIYTFPYFNTYANCTFYGEQIDNERFNFSFSVDFELVAGKPENMDNLLYRVLSMAKKQAFNNISYTKTLILPTENIPAETLNEIFNKMNEALFKFEELTEGLDVKNPLDEEYL